MSRSYLQILLWTLAVITPLLNLFAAIGNNVFTIYSLVALNSPLDLMEVVTAIASAFVLPAAPFAVLALFCQQEHIDGLPTFGTGAIAGASICAVISAIGGWALVWILVFLRGDNGAALGYWGIICSMPIFVPMLMIIGWSVGSRFDQPRV